MASIILEGLEQEVEGVWMNRDKIRSLGGTWSELELGEILDYGIDPVQTRERYYIDETSGERCRIKEYFITPGLVRTLSGN